MVLFTFFIAKHDIFGDFAFEKDKDGHSLLDLAFFFFGDSLGVDCALA